MTQEEARLRSDVVQEAHSWIRTPFRLGAMVKGHGVDCGCLLVASYGIIGVTVGEIGRFTIDWAQHTNEERYLSIVEKFADQVDVPLPGDIVLVRIFRSRPFCHAAIVTQWPYAIHALDGRSVEISDATKSPLKRGEQRFYSYFARERRLNGSFTAE